MVFYIIGDIVVDVLLIENLLVLFVGMFLD